MATKQSAGAHKSAPTRAKGRAPLFAAVDLGTNNCRLLIAERSGASFRVVDSFSRIVRLGEGLAANGELSGDAMDRAVDALRVCKSKILRQGVARTRCIATQACRAARNGGEFLARVQDEVGIKLDTISPKDEAKYAVLGSLDLIDQGKDFALVVDIGGGSTELSWVDARAAKRRGVAGCAKRPPILGWASFPIGVVTLSEAHPDLENGQYDKLVADVRGKFAEHDAANRFGPLFEAGRGHLLGTSGTVTSLAGVHLNLKKYARSRVDGQWISFDEATAARDRLRVAGVEGRAQEPCIGPERADLVLAGCAILDAVWDLWPSDRLRVADRGLREGVLLSLMNTSKRRRSRRRKSGGGGSPVTAS